MCSLDGLGQGEQTQVCKSFLGPQKLTQTQFYNGILAKL
jgi:hypothetical protein